MTINEREAEIVRRVFETYADTRIGLNKLAKQLEEEGVAYETGRKLWRASFLKTMLNNETYLGTKYYNKMRTIREYPNPIYGIEHSTKRYVPRSEKSGSAWRCRKSSRGNSSSACRSERRTIANATGTRDRSSFFRRSCSAAAAGMSAYGYRRWERSQAKGPMCIVHKHAYKCALDASPVRLHSKQSDIERCHNPEIKGQLLENCVFAAIEQVMLNPERLREWMDCFHEDEREAGERIAKELREIDGRLADLEVKKQRIVDIYLSGDLSRDGYVAKNRELDGVMAALRERAGELSASSALLNKRSQIDAAIVRYCSGARARFAECTDARTKRQFLLDYIAKVTFLNDKVSIHGRVPFGGESMDETGFPAFRIDREITKEDRKQERLRAIRTVHMQQAMSAIAVERSRSERDR